MQQTEILTANEPPLEATGPQVDLVFARAPDGRSYISHQRVGYPFHITRPFYLDPEPAGLLTLYLQSVSGGIYRGERLALSLKAKAGELVAPVEDEMQKIVARGEDGSIMHAEVEIGEIGPQLGLGDVGVNSHGA